MSASKMTNSGVATNMAHSYNNKENKLPACQGSLLLGKDSIPWATLEVQQDAEEQVLVLGNIV